MPVFVKHTLTAKYQTFVACVTGAAAQERAATPVVSGFSKACVSSAGTPVSPLQLCTTSTSSTRSPSHTTMIP